MALKVCLDCTAGFAVGAPRCPHCGSERHAEQGSAAALGVYASTSFREEPMPKITRHSGASIAAPSPEPVGGEDVSPGSNSSTSTGKPPPTPETSESARPRRAPKTGSRSRKARTDSSTAASTATSGPETGAADETA